MLGGSVTGVEYDENGNKKGFSPEKFLAGFASGALASKGLQISTKRLEKLAKTSPRAKALLERMQGKHSHAKPAQNNETMANQTTQTKNANLDTIANPKPRKDKNMLNNILQELFTSNSYVDYNKIKNYIALNPMPKPNFKNYAEFKDIFNNKKGNIGIINTPYKPVKVKIYKAYEHFTKNTNNKNRENIKGGFFNTLQDPLFIIKGERAGQKEPSIYFYKPFLSKDKKGKESVMNLFSIAVDYNGNLDFKTYYYDERSNRLKNVINGVFQGKSEVVYIKSPNG
ncbi:hypothetical protein [Helicobacter sp. T3_23-1059]